MYGSELMVAPVLEQKTFDRLVYFPKVILGRKIIVYRWQANMFRTFGLMCGLARRSMVANAI
jgi:hypothetical protein